MKFLMRWHKYNRFIAGVYIIKSKRTNKCYIGSSKYLTSRWTNHLVELKYNRHSNIKLQNHYNIFGENDLIFDVLEICKPYTYLLKEKEDYYLKLYNPYFNFYKSIKYGSPNRESILEIKK